MGRAAHETFGLLIAGVILWRFQRGPIGSHFKTSRIRRYLLVANSVSAGVSQQRLNDHFGLVVSALAEFVMSNATLRIDEVKCRPVCIVESAPDRVVAVDRNWIIDAHLFRGTPNVVDVLFKRELRRVHTDHDESLIFVFLAPRAEVRECAEPVDAGVGPEVDENDLPAK